MAANQAEVDLVVNAAGALPDLERQLNQIIREAEFGADEVDVQASLAVQHSIAVMSTQLQQAITDVDRTNPTIDVDAALDTLTSLSNLREDVGELTSRINSGLFDPIELAAELDLSRSLREVTEDLHDLVQDAERTAEAIHLDVELDEERASRRAERLTRSLHRIGEGARVAERGVRTMLLGTAGLSLAVGGAANTVAALAAALQQVAPAAAVGTSAILTQKLALGTLKLALIGVEEGIQNVFNQDLTASEFHKSIQGLAPEARLFVDEIHTMRRELRAVQQEVQNRVFRNFDDDLRSLTKTLGPTITRALNSTADSLNAMGRNAVVAANQMGKQGVLGQALTGATTALETLEKVPARAVRSFTFLAAASSPALNRIALAIDDVSLRVQNKLQRAFESGALERSIDKAVATLAQLGTVIQNFGGGISNIFSGLTQNGRGLFQILEDISEGFERLTASREFQTILGELALTADTLVQNILPLIQEAFVQLAPVIETLAPVVRDFVTAIGPELIPVIQELGPILLDIAVLLQEQLPNAIIITKTFLEALVIALQAVQFIMEEAVLPAIRKVNEFLNSEFIQTIQDVFNTVTDSFPQIGDKFAELNSRAADAINGMIQVLGDLIGKIRDEFVEGIVATVNEAIREFLNLRDGIVGAISDLPDQMFSIGINIIDGLTGGLVSQVGSLISTAQGIADSISSTIRGALDIHSPSRVTRAIGRDVVDGLIVGMASRVAPLKAASEHLAGVITGAFPQTPTANIGQVRIPGTTGLGTSVVNVYIGNQLVKQIIDDRLRAMQNQRDRTYAMGVRL
jgi:phage-related protein